MPLYSQGMNVVSGTDPVNVDIIQFSGSVVSVQQVDDTMLVTIDPSQNPSLVCPTFDTDVNYHVPPLSAAYMEYSGSVVFPDSLTWYTDVSKSQILRVDAVVARNSANFPTIESFSYYDINGNLACVFVDQINYTNNVFQTSRLRLGPFLSGPLHIDPVTATLRVGGEFGTVTQQYHASGTYYGGTYGPALDAQVTWTLGTPASSSISNSGLLTIVTGTGATQYLTATYTNVLNQTFSGSASFTSPTLSTISFAPATSTIESTATLQLYPTGTWSDAINILLTAPTWTLSNNTVSTITSGGLFSWTQETTIDVTVSASEPSGRGTMVTGTTRIRQFAVLSAVQAHPNIPNNIVGGNIYNGVISLNRAAPSGGAQVAVTVSNPSWCQIVASGTTTASNGIVTVPSGNLTANFKIITYPLTYASPDVHTCSFTASWKGKTVYDDIYVISPALFKDYAGVVSHFYVSASAPQDTQGFTYSLVTPVGTSASYHTVPAQPSNVVQYPTREQVRLNPQNAYPFALNQPYFVANTGTAFQAPAPYTIAAVVSWPPRPGIGQNAPWFFTTWTGSIQGGLALGSDWDGTHNTANYYPWGPGNFGEPFVVGAGHNPIPGDTNYYLIIAGAHGTGTKNAVQGRNVASGNLYNYIATSIIYTGSLTSSADWIGTFGVNPSGNYDVATSSLPAQIGSAHGAGLAEGWTAAGTGSVLEIYMTAEAPTQAVVDRITSGVLQMLKLGTLS